MAAGAELPRIGYSAYVQPNGTMTGLPPDPRGVIPPATTSLGGAAQDRANIDYLLNPYANLSETRMNAAEQNLGAGTSGSGFGSGTTAKLLDSERIARFQLGHQLLEPYLQREFQAGQSAADRAARLNEIAAEGAQALQRLQLSEAGETARLTQEEQAKLQQQAVIGQQAMQQIAAQEAGQTGRTRLNITGNILTNLLSDYAKQQGGSPVDASGRVRVAPPGTNVTATGAFSSPNYVTQFDWASQLPVTRTAAPSVSGGGTTGGISLSTIDNILRRYGLS